LLSLRFELTQLEFEHRSCVGSKVVLVVVMVVAGLVAACLGAHIYMSSSDQTYIDLDQLESWNQEDHHFEGAPG
jgi:hypothetical protein